MAKSQSRIERFAPAKINLALDVLAKRPDGYHDVDMIMQTLELADKVTLSPHPHIELSCTNPKVPVDRRNLAWRAVERLWDVTGERRGVQINIEKNIPIAAGLAGGSADAAAVLLGLNELWQLKLSLRELMAIALPLGADVPFCILRQTARAEGIGERLTPLTSRLSGEVLVVTPDFEVVTKAVYQQFNLASIQKRPVISRVVEAVETGDLALLASCWGNVLENVVFNQFPAVFQLTRQMAACGMDYIRMSGSGPTVFALAPSPSAVKALLATIPRQWFICLTRLKNTNGSENEWSDNR